MVGDRQIFFLFVAEMDPTNILHNALSNVHDHHFQQNYHIKFNLMLMEGGI